MTLDDLRQPIPAETLSRVRARLNAVLTSVALMAEGDLPLGVLLSIWVAARYAQTCGLTMAEGAALFAQGYVESEQLIAAEQAGRN